MNQPRPAATLVLLRPEDQGFSVLLMKRPSRSSFLGGMHVFPGGKVEATDHGEPSALAHRLANRMALPAATVEAYISAAVRETFEEMGLLLHSACPPDEARTARRRMAAGELQWGAWEYRRFDDGVALAYFDHWITPTIEPKRFDTRFFAALLPAGAEAEPNEEAISWGFFRPQEALAKTACGDIAMAPPTLVTVQRLAAYTTAEAALTGLGSRIVAPLQPELAGTDPLVLALPGHPAHPEKNRLPDNPYSLILRDSCWEIVWDSSNQQAAG